MKASSKRKLQVETDPLQDYMLSITNCCVFANFVYCLDSLGSLSTGKFGLNEHFWLGTDL